MGGLRLAEVMAQDRKIFVGGVPQQLTSEDLYNIFEEHGVVKKAWLQKCRHSDDNAFPPQNHRGFGFVIFQDARSIEELIGPRPSKFLELKTGHRLEIKRAVSSNKLGREREEQPIEVGSRSLDMLFPPMSQTDIPPAFRQPPGLDPMHLRSLSAPGTMNFPGAMRPPYPAPGALHMPSLAASTLATAFGMDAMQAASAPSTAGLSTMAPSFGQHLRSSSCSTASTTDDDPAVLAMGHDGFMAVKGTGVSCPKLRSQTSAAPASQGLRLVHHFDI